MALEESFDVVVVGASFAGLQAALVLARAGYDVVVIDGGPPRNGVTPWLSNFFSAADAAPSTALARCRTAAVAAGARITRSRVVDATRKSSGVHLTTSTGRRLSSRHVLLATGMRDELPAIPGVLEHWGTRVFGCPHCHAHELRERPLAQLGLRSHPALGPSRALLLRQWSENVVLCTDGVAVSDSDKSRLSERGIRIMTAPISRIGSEQPGSTTVVFDNDDRLQRDALFTAFALRPHGDLAKRLDCAVFDTANASGVIETTPQGATRTDGVWAAGTCTDPSLLAIAAAGHGATVATAIVARDTA